jgi:16S rRNA (uracil1498-N3)-methyltransferase
MITKVRLAARVWCLKRATPDNTPGPRAALGKTASSNMVITKRRVPRLYLERDLGGATLRLDEREAHYLGHVLRLKRGDELVAFDGRGAERRAKIASLQRRGAELELDATLEPLPPSRLDLVLVQALPKSDAMDFVVQKATELGVRTIVPVYSEFSVVRLDAERADRRVEHWRKIAQSACEQCGRHEPPEIRIADALAAALAGLPDAGARVALDLESRVNLADAASAPARLVAAVGPEGGFGSNDWRQLDAAHFARARLGRRVLRAETAAVATCAVAQALWGDL